MSSSRTGIPLSVKLMLTTSIVVAAAVAISAWYGQRTIAALARENVAARRTTGEAAIVRESELLARNVATAAAIPMAQQAYGEVKPLITATLREYPRIQWIAIASEGKLVAATDGAPTVDFADLTDARGAVGHRRVAEDRPDWIYGTTIRLGEQAVGQLRLGVSTADLDAELARAVASGDERAKASKRTVWMVALALLAVGVVMAAAQGMDLDEVHRVIQSCAGNSWMFANRGAHVVAGDYTPHSAVDIFVKDVGIVTETARDAGAPAPLSETALELFRQASAAGLGRRDDAAVALHLARQAGVKLPGDE